MNNLDFTIYSEDTFYDVVDARSFKNEDAKTVYGKLQSKLKLISFGDYLKRYIHRKAGYEENEDVDIKEYQHIIADCFAENMTPKSFTETTTKMSVLSKSWLTSSSVNRKTVFLLGFGLNMSVEDVEEFLIHAQRERSFNFKDPFEIICWYCFKMKYKFPKFRQLFDEYENLPVNAESNYYGTSTIFVNGLFSMINSDDDLMAELSKLKAENNGKMYSVTALESFNELYQRTKEIIAYQFTQDAESEAELKAEEYLGSSSNSMTPRERYIRASRIRASYQKFTADDITDGDVEKFLCCGHPFDAKGNLKKLSLSKLSKHFDNKRMSRQHLHDIAVRRVQIDRFDLISLCFFIYAMDDTYENPQKRYTDFCEFTDSVLMKNFMGKLYITNPYENFILMCILSECPMETYAEVMEMSFNDKYE